LTPKNSKNLKILKLSDKNGKKQPFSVVLRNFDFEDKQAVKTLKILELQNFENYTKILKLPERL
jgi:hypothetical protein